MKLSAIVGKSVGLKILIKAHLFGLGGKNFRPKLDGNLRKDAVAAFSKRLVKAQCAVGAIADNFSIRGNVLALAGKLS